MRLFFISDLHLHPSRPEITQAFYHFLSTTAKNASALYILGDLFEAWLGDDDDTPMYRDVINAINHYSQNGIAVYVMHGNRDFLLGDVFATQANITLIDDPCVIHHDGHPYLLMHGDSLCTKDNDYMQFRAMTRTREWQQQALANSLEDRRAYAKALREKSHHMTSLKADDILDVTPEEVVKVMAQHHVATLIHGHTHRPNTHDLIVNNLPAKRIVLGDWERKGWYITIDDSGLSLHDFPISALSI